MAEPPDILQRICSDKLLYVERQKKNMPEKFLEKKAGNMPPTRGFSKALTKKIKNKEFALIAEIKKASPSRGVIRENFDPVDLAKQYRDGGATCLSVLTDEPYFRGKNEYLTSVSEAVYLPVLRKDFILDVYQVTESRSIGADCILLIMAVLNDQQAAEMEAKAISWEMDVLVEIHDEKELKRAMKLKSKLIGINNRNLKTLEVDLSVTEKIAPKIPDDYIIICESGIYTHEDLTKISEKGVYSFLVGESLMSKENVRQATISLLAG